MREKITKLLADFLGVEPTDITEDDSLTEDLHMTPTDLVDFTDILEKSGIDTTGLDFTEVETVTDLYEKFT